MALAILRSYNEFFISSSDDLIGMSWEIYTLGLAFMCGLMYLGLVGIVIELTSRKKIVINKL